MTIKKTKLVLICIFISIWSFPASSGVKGADLVNDYLEANSLREAVAQLIFVGIPADYKNIEYDKNTRILLSRNIGGAVINAYNLPGYLLKNNDRKTAYGNVYHFIKNIRKHSNNGAKLLISADFESSRFTSLRYPFVVPPSAMTLSATNNTKYAYLSGKLVGYQFQQAGINVIFGPVMDLAKPRQGSLNTALKNRSWGSNPNLTVNMAGRYIDGLREHNILTIGKHIPGFGSVDENPHNNESRYDGSKSSMDEELAVVNELTSSLDGLMTSHVSIGFTNIEDPLTANRRLMDHFFSSKGLIPGFSDQKLLVTDDLSDMAAINHYKIKKGWGYKDLALASFKAGHDVLLFSHFSPHSKFNIQNLDSVINELTKYCETNEGKDKLRKSLGKILLAKEKLNDSSLLGIKPTKKFDYKAAGIFEGTEFLDSSDFIAKLYDNSTIEISKSRALKDFSILERLNGNKIINIYGREKYFEHIKSEIKDNRVHYISKSDFELDNRKLQVDKYKESIVASLGNDDFVILFAENKEDFDIVHYIYIYEQDLIDRFIVVVNESAEILEREVLIGSNLIGAFSQDAKSAGAIARILSGAISPIDIAHMPIDLNDGVYFDVSDRPYVELDSRATPYKILFKTTEERRLYEKIVSIRKQFSIGVAVALLPIFIFLIIILFFVSAYVDENHSDFKRRDVFKPLNPWYWIKNHWLLTLGIIALVIFEIQLFFPDSFLVDWLAGYLHDDINELIIESVKKAQDFSPDLYGDRISQW
jgi:beta-N-acetylhexosaminidase